jgi:hypothetical protein
MFAKFESYNEIQFLWDVVAFRSVRIYKLLEKFSAAMFRVCAIQEETAVKSRATYFPE